MVTDDTNWLHHPTKNPFELIKRKLLREFVSHMEEWADDGRIPTEEKDSILYALHEPEAQTYLDLFIQQNIIGLVVRTEVLVVLGGVLTGGLGAIYGALFGEGLKMFIKNMHAQVICRRIPFLKRQKVAAATMPMVIGAFTPLLFLHKKHPSLYKYFRLYFKARKFYNIVDHHKNDSKPFGWIERQYLKHNLGDKPITPDNINDLERCYFNKLLAGFKVVEKGCEECEVQAPELALVK